MAKKKAFLLRLDPTILESLQKWAADDLRSANSQMEYLLRRALKSAGRLNGNQGPPDDEGQEERREQAVGGF